MAVLLTVPAHTNKADTKKRGSNGTYRYIRKERETHRIDRRRQAHGWARAVRPALAPWDGVKWPATGGMIAPQNMH